MTKDSEHDDSEHDDSEHDNDEHATVDRREQRPADYV